MHTVRTRLILLVIAVLATSGCVTNMGDLKEALGFREPPPPDPVYAPPEARALANATLVLAGAPVRFTGEQSRDPQGLPLAYRWRFGDADAAEGAVVTRAFDAPGEWRVTLNVTNAAGLGDEATLVVQVTASNRPPVAQFVVEDAAGRPTRTVEAGATVRFSAAPSGDPDGDAVTYEWDFGDGATSHDPAPRKSFAKAGLYDVKLRVTDARGLSATASRLVAVNGAYAFEGAFEPTGPTARSHAFAVPDGLARLEARLAFPSALGANDLVLVLKDASGREVDRTAAGVPPGEQDAQAREIVLVGEALRAFKPGEWRVEVVKEKGLQPQYEIALRLTY